MPDISFDDPSEWALTRGDLVRERVGPRSADADHDHHRLCDRCGKTLDNECLRCTLGDILKETQK